MDAASIAATIHDRLVKIAHRYPQPGQLGAVILEDDVVFVHASDGKVYRVTVEPWP